MAKGAASGTKRRRGETWTGSDHAVRSAKQQAKSSGREEMSYRERRTAAVTRDSKDKRESNKLRLHITKTEREIKLMRDRLRSWDEVSEVERERKLREDAKKAQDEEPVKKKGRKGPETWKLRGAARPAWEVYDFDTRYVDPHIEAHKDAANKAQRSQNILALFKGRMGQEEGGPPQPISRNFLAILMRLGLLCLHAEKFKSARAAFLECMDLDGTDHPITAARCRLMRLYLEANRPDSARRLWERLPNDTSVWIRYSAALVEFVSWKILGEKGSSRESAEELLAKAIQANVFCAYHLAFFSTFERVMEYTDEIEDAHEQSLEEAIEYCASEQRSAWMGTEGAVEWLQQVVLRALQGRTIAGGKLKRSDLEWKDKLSQLEEDYEPIEEDNTEGNDEKDVAEENDDEDEPDVKMYAGMFHTAMEMLHDAGEFTKPVQDPVDELKQQEVAVPALGDDKQTKSADGPIGSDSESGSDTS